MIGAGWVRTAATGLPWVLVHALIASLLVLTLVLAGNYLVFREDSTALLAATRNGFSSGALPDHHTNAPDRRNGSFTYHDCLILSMALEDRPAPALRVVSPSRPRSTDPSWQDPGACAILYDIVMLDNRAAYAPAPYHRYVSGPIAPAALLVPYLGVQGYRTVLRTANYVLCGSLLAATLLGFMRVRAQVGRVRRKMLAGAIIFGMFLTFSGMEFFAQNLSIGLADLSVYALFGVLLFTSPVAMSRRRMMAISSVAFATIGALEYWTGQIPIALAGGIGLIALDVAVPADRSQAWARMVDFGLTAVSTILLLFGLKVALASFVFDDDVMENFLRQLSTRVGGQEFGVGGVLLHLGGSLDYLGQGSLVVGLLNAAAAIVAGTLGLRMIFAPMQTDPVPRMVAWGLVLSVVVIVAWHLVFRNHSTVHAFFMVRTLAWAAAAGWILFAIGRERRQCTETCPAD